MINFKKSMCLLLAVCLLAALMPSFSAVATAPETPQAGAVVVADPDSPTGYTGQFTYYNATAQMVYFCGDLNLGNFADPTDTKVYAPTEYKPGLMRRGGSQFKVEMQKLDGGYWYYELPLCAGANQYWFIVDNNRRMMPDPANHPLWSPNSDENSKDAYNAVYVPYSEKQAFAPLQERTAELPYAGEDKGSWSYVPYSAGGKTYYMAVYLPYGYDKARATPYKTIYLIHGYGQDESDWMGIGSAQNIMDNLIAEGRTEPAVLVSLSLNNGAIGDQNTKFSNLFDVVLPFVEANYNVSAKAEDRSLSGLSMGSRYTKYIMECNAPAFGYYGLYSCSELINMSTEHLDKAHIFVSCGAFEAANYVNGTTTNLTNLAAAGSFYATREVAGAHDFNTWSQLLRIYIEDYLWKPAAFGEACTHDYKAVITTPTCTEAGFTTYTCAKCGDSYKADETSALGHDYKETATAPTCTEAGFTSHTCARCGFSYNDSETAALTHDYVNGVCTRCGCDDPEYQKPCDGGEACPGKDYSDMPGFQDWAHAGIDYCIENKLMNGVSATVFAPNGSLTRAQLVTILYRRNGSPKITTANSFADVKPGVWYYEAIEWAAAEQVVNGVGNDRFDPEGKITREQIATILYRYSGKPEVEGDLSKYPDHAGVSSYAADALLWATSTQLINGINANGVINLKPSDNATRAQIAAIMMRYCAMPQA